MFVSASIGIALSTTGSYAGGAPHNADTAMYLAKTNGKARFEFFNEGLREQVVARFEIETGLRKAIRRTATCSSLPADRLARR